VGFTEQLFIDAELCSALPPSRHSPGWRHQQVVADGVRNTSEQTDDADGLLPRSKGVIATGTRFVMS